MYTDWYLEALKKNETREYFLGKGKYYSFDRECRCRDFHFSSKYCISKLGEQNLYNHLSQDIINVLKYNNVTSSQFSDLILFIGSYYSKETWSYDPDCYHYDWVYPEELTKLLNINLNRLRIEGKRDDINEIDEMLDSLKEIHNVDLLNFDRINVIGSPTVLSRVPKDTKGEYIVPDGIVRIPNYAFAECEEITSVVMPDSVTSIGWYSFHGCKKLKNVKLSENLSFMGLDAFENCDCLESIFIPKSVKCTLNHGTFRKDIKLKEIIVNSENQNYASKDGVLYTKDMKKLIFCPQNIELKELRIPPTVIEVERCALCKCRNVEVVYIPENLKTYELTLWNSFLSGFTSLKEIHIAIKDNIEERELIGDLEDYNNGCKFYVPKGTKRIYKKFWPDIDSHNIIEEGSELSSLDSIEDYEQNSGTEIKEEQSLDEETEKESVSDVSVEKYIIKDCFLYALYVPIYLYYKIKGLFNIKQNGRK